MQPDNSDSIRRIHLHSYAYIRGAERRGNRRVERVLRSGDGSRIRDRSTRLHFYYFPGDRRYSDYFHSSYFDGFLLRGERDVRRDRQSSTSGSEQYIDQPYVNHQRLNGYRNGQFDGSSRNRGRRCITVEFQQCGRQRSNDGNNPAGRNLSHLHRQRRQRDHIDSGDSDRLLFQRECSVHRHHQPVAWGSEQRRSQP